MGIDLRDRETGEFGFHVNFWNWRPIVELVRSLDVIDDATAKSLHEQFAGTGLTHEQSRLVAMAIRRDVLPRLRDESWLGLKQQDVDERPPGTRVFLEVLKRGDDISHNYRTNRKMIEGFVAYLESCNGFEVL